MLYVKLTDRKEYDSKFVTVEIKMDFNPASGQFLRINGYNWARGSRLYYKSYDLGVAESKQKIKKVIDHLKEAHKYFKLEHYKLVSKKTNVSKALEDMARSL